MCSPADIAERTRLTLEALASVDAGLSVDDAKVAAWIESLETNNPLPLPCDEINPL